MQNETHEMGQSWNVEIILRGEDGKIKESRNIHNLVTTQGKYHVADQLSSSPTQTAMGYMGIGTGSTAAAITDTTLETELDRNALTSRTDALNIVTYVGNWAAGDGTGSITEAGIFNASSSGTMLVRAVFSTINKAALDTLLITWTLTVI